MFKQESKKPKKKHELSEWVIIVISLSFVLAVAFHDTLVSVLLLCLDFLAAIFDRVMNDETFGEAKQS